MGAPTASVRARLARQGARALTDAELLAVLLRTGDVGRPVGELSKQLLEEAGGLHPLLHDADGRPELAVVLELARRATAEQLRSRDTFGSPDAVKSYLQLHLAHLPGRSSRCCSSTRRIGSSRCG
jgi:DNA repair protein RadC